MLTALIASVSFTAVDAQRLITDYHDSADSLSSGRLIEVSEDDRVFPSAQTVMQVIGEKPKPIVSKRLAPGSVKYRTSVGADGQLNVEVPIESFAAKFEADPGIALNYNGMSAASFMGDGWSITGLHTIMPTERTIFTDGRCSGIDGDGEYAYALDGQRLIKLSENDSCLVFQGQSDLTRAVYHKSADRFSVMYANGQVGLFAKMIDQSYRLIELTYPDCRKIKYNYGNFIGQHSDIESVEYGDGKKITFSYIIAKDDAKNVLTYLGGQKLESVKKIGGITVTFNDKTLLSYRLNYSQESNMHSPVASIELRGKDGSCLNPLKFTYGSTALSDGTSFNSRQQTSAFVSIAGQFITKGKFDTSSGEDGIVEFINKAPYKRAGDLCVNGYNGKEQILITPSLNGYDNLLNTTQIVAEDGFVDAFAMDADDEYGDELVKVRNVLAGSTDRTIFTVYKLGGYAHTMNDVGVDYKIDNPAIYSENGQDYCIRPKSFLTGDFDGDGREELAVAYATGLGFMGGTGAVALDGARLEIYRFGDSRIDCLGSFSIGSYDLDLNSRGIELANSERLFAIDVDGDGRQEVCLVRKGGMAIYRFNRGEDGMFVMENWKTVPFPSLNDLQNYGMCFGEFNGDGIPDIALTFNDYSNLKYGQTETVITYLGCGNGTFERKSACKASSDDVAYCGSKNVPVHFSYMTQDTNMDGQSEIVKYATDANGRFRYYAIHVPNGVVAGRDEVGPDASRSWQLVTSQLYRGCHNVSLVAVGDSGRIVLMSCRRPQDAARLMTSPSDGLGNAYSFGYKRMFDNITDLGPDVNKYKFPYTNFYGEQLLCSEVKKYSTDGTLASSEEYTYGDAVMHRQGLGFCGFSSIRCVDNITGDTTMTISDPLNFGAPVFKSNRLEENSFEYKAAVNANKTIDIQVTQKSSIDRATGKRSVTSYTYDGYRNVVCEATDYGSGFKQIKRSKYLNDVSHQSNVIGLPLLETNTVEVDGKQSTTGRRITYNTSNLPETVEEFYGEEGNLVKTQRYTYDELCNLITEEVRNYNSDEWVVKKHKYVTDKEGNSGKTLVADVDEKGLVTKYKYCGFGVSVSVDVKPWFFIGQDSAVAAQDANAGRGGAIGEIEIPSVSFDGFETITRYDAFGRVDSVGDGVGNSKVTHLSWAEDAGPGCYVTTVAETGKPDRREVFDGFDREVQSAEMRPDGLWLKRDKAYDSRGNLVSESLPYTKEQPQFLTMEYDHYGRMTRKQWPSGRYETYLRHGLSTTSTVDGITSTKCIDPLGRDIEVKRPDGTVKYTLRPDGQPEAILVNGSISTTFEYDGFGRKSAINDPSAGRKEYAYDAAGNLTSETDARGKKVMSQYDKLGRVVLKKHDGVAQSFKYDRDGNIESVTQSDGQWLRYGYDIARRVVQADDNGYVRNYNYVDGNVAEIRHVMPRELHLDDMVERYSYSRGTLTEVSVDNVGVLWRLNAEDDGGLPSATSGMGINTSLSCDGDMRLSWQVTKNKSGAVLHDMEYNFDPETGNLMSRTDHLGYGEEQFEYDELNRLVSYGNGQEVEYDEKGNIFALNAAEEYNYDSSRPYAVNSVETDEGAADQRIVFNALQMPDSIMQGGVTAAFTYGCDGQRSLMRIRDGRGNGTDTRYYGDQQFTLLSHRNGDDVKNVAIMYVGGTPYSAPVALVNNIYDCSGWQVYNIVRDHLGSISEIVDTAGRVVQSLRYDAWGNLCDPYTQEAYTAANTPQLMLGRGYCGHEHLLDFGLINMNARLYDPAVGRFLSPDPQVQLPDNVQNYNRYSYCLNNPLRYRDEDGEFFLGLVVGFFRGIFTWQNPFKTAWRTAVNETKIQLGLLKSDWSHGFFKGLKQLVSRFTWESLQTMVGMTYSMVKNWMVDTEVRYFGGATFVINFTGKGPNYFKGVTIGSFINIDDGHSESTAPVLSSGKFEPKNSEGYVHEYGHYIQSQGHGPLYLNLFGIPSLIDCAVNKLNHRSTWTEKDATTRGMAYFEKEDMLYYPYYSMMLARHLRLTKFIDRRR